MSVAPAWREATLFRDEDPHRRNRPSLAPFSAFALVSGVGASSFEIE
jgi:hypothetical protein